MFESDVYTIILSVWKLAERIPVLATFSLAVYQIASYIVTTAFHYGIIVQFHAVIMVNAAISTITTKSAYFINSEQTELNVCADVYSQQNNVTDTEHCTVHTSD